MITTHVPLPLHARSLKWADAMKLSTQVHYGLHKILWVLIYDIFSSPPFERDGVGFHDRAVRHPTAFKHVSWHAIFFAVHFVMTEYRKRMIKYRSILSSWIPCTVGTVKTNTTEVNRDTAGRRSKLSPSLLEVRSRGSPPSTGRRQYFVVTQHANEPKKIKISRGRTKFKREKVVTHSISNEGPVKRGVPLFIVHFQERHHFHDVPARVSYGCGVAIWTFFIFLTTFRKFHASCFGILTHAHALPIIPRAELPLPWKQYRKEDLLNPSRFEREPKVWEVHVHHSSAAHGRELFHDTGKEILESVSISLKKQSCWYHSGK